MQIYYNDQSSLLYDLTDQNLYKCIKDHSELPKKELHKQYLQARKDLGSYSCYDLAIFSSPFDHCGKMVKFIMQIGKLPKNSPDQVKQLLEIETLVKENWSSFGPEIVDLTLLLFAQNLITPGLRKHLRHSSYEEIHAPTKDIKVIKRI